MAYHISLVEEMYRTRGGAITKVIFSQRVKWIQGTTYIAVSNLWRDMEKQQERLEVIHKKAEAKRKEVEKRETIAKLKKVWEGK